MFRLWINVFLYSWCERYENSHREGRIDFSFIYDGMESESHVDPCYDAHGLMYFSFIAGPKSGAQDDQSIPKYR